MSGTRIVKERVAQRVKLIVAGGRDFIDYELLCDEVNAYLQSIAAPFDLTILSGCATGADQLGERYAKSLSIPVERHPADWAHHGFGAGPRRNRKMAATATHCICFWDGKSRGTKNMIDEAFKVRLGLKVVHYSA